MEANHSIFNDIGNDHDGDDQQQSFLSENYTLLAVTTIILSAVLAIVSCWLREVCYDACGIEFCSGSMPTARRREIRRNQIRAMQLQRQMERDLQESSAAKQKERMKFYGEFLQKFSKVLTEADIAVEEVDESKATVEPTRNLRFCAHDACKEHHVEATCIICFKDYEAGEQVVWSSSETCRHVYHIQCILKWLATGKKKCPICRSWFVPDTCLDGSQNSDQPGDQGNDPVSTEARHGLDSV